MSLITGIDVGLNLNDWLCYCLWFELKFVIVVKKLFLQEETIATIEVTEIVADEVVAQ